MSNSNENANEEVFWLPDEVFAREFANCRRIPADKAWVNCQYVANIMPKEGETSVDYKRPKRFPAGVLRRAKTDQDFSRKLLQTAAAEMRHEMLQLADWTCFNCNRKAKAFVQSIGMHPDHDPFSFVDMLAIPICADSACNIAAQHQTEDILRDVMGDAQADSRIRICSNCKKGETEDHKMDACGRCKVTYYCSKECQRKDWPVHKKFCTPK